MWIGALVLLCVLLSASIVILFMHKPPAAPEESVLERMIQFVPRRLTPAGGTVYGADTAPIVIQAYLDFTCKHCRDFERDAFPKLRTEYIEAGKVKWIARILPHADQGAPLFFAVAAHCGRLRPDSGAIEQALFAYPIPSPKSGFDALAEAVLQAGIDTAAVTEITDCMNKRGPEMQQQLLVEVQQAFSYGLKGPPAFVIDGIAFQGSMEYETMSGLIRIFLKDRGL